MKRQMGVEARKMLVNRSVWGIVVATIVVTAVGALQTAIAAEEGKALWERQGFFLATINMRLFLLVLGAKFVTDEFRFGTIVPALLITPRRERFVAAKLAVLGVGGLVLAGGLWALIGGAAGFRVRHHVGAIVGAIVWLIAVDQILVGRPGDLGSYPPSDAGRALAIAPSVRVMVLGGLILAAYAAGAAVLGTILTQRRDVA